MGGGSKSSSSNTTKTSIVDNRIAAEGSLIATGNAQINYLSDEAMGMSLDFAEGAFTEAGALIEQAFEAIISGNKAAYEQIGKSTQSAFEQSATAMAAQRTEEFQGLKELLSTVSVVAVAVGFFYFTGRK
jgi:hypothetical protein